jgi:STE24 endopeptidase
VSNPVYYLFGLVLALSYPTGSEPLRFAAHPAGSLAAWAGAMLFLSLLCLLTYPRIASFRRLHWARLALKTTALFLYALVLFVFHWPLLVWLRLEDVPFAGDLAVLLPFLALMGVHALFSVRAEARLRQAEARGLLSFAWKTFWGFAMLPVLVMMILQAALTAWPPVTRIGSIYPFVAWTLSIAILAGLLALAPFYLRLVFRARPLPPGPRRDRLEALARRAGFRCRDLLLLETGGSKIANAFIVGIHPSMRYVFFTDLLYHGLREDELECVMAHEMTHALRRHIFFYLCFTLAFVLALLFVQEFLFRGGVGGVGSALFVLGAAFLFWIVIFGFVSRRFETEADLVGMRLAGDAGPEPLARSRRFAGALHRVADLNGVPPGIGSWRHWSVARRSMILLNAEARPEIAAAFERTCAALRMACLAAFVFGLLYAGFLVRKQVADAPKARADWELFEKANRGWNLLNEGRAEEALPLLEESSRHPHARGELFVVLAEAYEKVGRLEDAEEARRTAVKRGLSDPRFRLRVSKR